MTYECVIILNQSHSGESRSFKKKVYTVKFTSHPLPFNRNIESLLLMKLTFEFNDLNGKGHFANDMNLILMCDVYKGKINKRSFGQLH